ncbi:MAG: AsnC family protein [Lacunisphaera sp.]|nr:AsnC family protein [Lacunisphaera sp.]
MFTKAQDIVVALKLALADAPRPSYADLAADLGMSASEVHAAVRRLGEARLLDPETQEVRREALRNFLIHGVPHAFPTRTREVTRGLPTAWAAPVLAGKISAGEQIPPVWPDPDGQVQGAAVKPLYSSVPHAARRDPALYDLLALVDALRLGRARERALAEKELSKRLIDHATA